MLMFPFWQPRGCGGGGGGNGNSTVGSSSGESGGNGGVAKSWMQEVEEKKRGWKKDPNGGWIRDGRGSEPNINLINNNLNSSSSAKKLPTPFLNKSSSNLWNRRRTNSTTNLANPSELNLSSPTTSTSGCGGSNSQGSFGRASVSQRGSSVSPKASQSKGYWVQEPEEFHQRWVATNKDAQNGETTSSTITSPFTWPPAGGSGLDRERRGSFTSQPSSPQKTSTPPMVGSSPSWLPKVYKSQATWMSGDGGDGTAEGHGLGDFQNRVKRFQQDQQFNQQQSLLSSRSSTNASSSSSSSSQVKRSQLSSSSSHSMSSSNLSEMKASSSSTTKSSIAELKSSMSEVKSSFNELTASNNFSRNSSSAIQQSSSSAVANALSSSTSSSSGAGFKLKPKMGSMDALNGAVTIGSPDRAAVPNVNIDDELGLDGLQQDALGTSPLGGSGKEVKFEQKKVTSSSKTKVVTDKNSFETASDRSAESRKVQSGDMSYEEMSNKAASKSKVEVDGITAEKAAAIAQDARQLRAGDVTHREGSQVKGAAMRVTGEGFSSHKSAVSEQQQRQTITPSGTINQESSRKAAKSGLTITTKGICTKKSSSVASAENNISITGFEDLGFLSDGVQPIDIQNAIMKFSHTMTDFVDKLKVSNIEEQLGNAPSLLSNIDEMIRKAWSVPTYGHELGSSLCNTLRHNGGLDILLDSCVVEDNDLKFSSARVLEQCLTTENRHYVVENGLENVVNVACDCTQRGHSVDQHRVGTGILEHLFKHSEGTCADIIKLGGLEAVLRECRKTDSDVETLRHCAGALANLSLYGGSENHQAMIKHDVASWLFPLAFHNDDNIKYYACLAIAALVANKEIEAAVLKSDTLGLIEPFITKHLPEEFADSTPAHRHGQSRDWLERLVPVLLSKRDEARNLAAFHFCMEAGIKKQQNNIDIFHEIHAIEPLKTVASSPNAIASKYAARALFLMGEEVPHKLSQQVPLWSSEDVREWVKQIGFGKYADSFVESRVDGDLLLQLDDCSLCEDIGIQNGILRKRFLRELAKLKRLADYSSCDSTGLNDCLKQLDLQFSQYTYAFVQAGITRDFISYLEERHLDECSVVNSVHRDRILSGVKSGCGLQDTSSVDKSLDIFISYRRSNGSQLASLLKVHLQLKGFSVFIDVERLEAGKFDNNLLNSIRQAKNFLLVLTPNALDRCIGDDECKDWVHKEIVAALEAKCNIIPILDNFQWPETETLPVDMRAVCHFNGVRWIHDYQTACVEKLDRFMRGEGATGRELGRYYGGPNGGMVTPGTPRVPHIYQRTASTESGKESSCSDKDFYKD